MYQWEGHLRSLGASDTYHQEREHNENVILHEKMCDLRFERIDAGTQIPGFYLDSTSFWLCDDGQVTPHLCILNFLNHKTWSQLSPPHRISLRTKKRLEQNLVYCKPSVKDHCFPWSDFWQPEGLSDNQKAKKEPSGLSRVFSLVRTRKEGGDVVGSGFWTH